MHLEIAMSYKRSSGQTNQKSAIAVPAPPLGVADQAFFQSVINGVAPGWTVDLEGICVNEASLILMPDGGEDQIGPSFSITREAYSFRLDQVQWDEMTEIGVYASLREVLDIICRRLAFCDGVVRPGSVTIH
jgi:hypothetical protein